MLNYKDYYLIWKIPTFMEILRDNDQKRKEIPYMELSRDNDQKRKETLYMELSRDNGQKRCAYK